MASGFQLKRRGGERRLILDDDAKTDVVDFLPGRVGLAEGRSGMFGSIVPGSASDGFFHRRSVIVGVA